MTEKELQNFYENLSEEQRAYVFRMEMKKHSSKGGKTTLVKHGTDYFKKINQKSHETKRQNKLMKSGLN